MRRIVVGAVLALCLASPALAPSQTPAPCNEEGGPWLLVYRYHFYDDLNRIQIRERFDGARFPSEEDAYCGAALRRQTGVILPTLDRYGRDSNVIPDAITPMLALHHAVEAEP